MRLFVYEHLMAGGFGPQPPSSLLAEGRAMLLAIVEDFAAAGHQVSTILHPTGGWPSDLPASIELVEDEQARRAALAQLARAADWSLVIAPEIDQPELERELVRIDPLSWSRGGARIRFVNSQLVVRNSRSVQRAVNRHLIQSGALGRPAGGLSGGMGGGMMRGATGGMGGMGGGMGGMMGGGFGVPGGKP